jgi:hypothetical protein
MKHAKYKIVTLNVGDRWPKWAWHAPYKDMNLDRAKNQLAWFTENKYSEAAFKEDYALRGAEVAVDTKRIAVVLDEDPEVNEFGPVVA